MDLVKIKKLRRSELRSINAQALKLDRRGYTVSKDIYAQTPRAVTAGRKRPLPLTAGAGAQTQATKELRPGNRPEPLFAGTDLLHVLVDPIHRLGDSLLPEAHLALPLGLVHLGFPALVL